MYQVSQETASEKKNDLGSPSSQVRSFVQAKRRTAPPPPSHFPSSLAGIGNYHNNLLAPLMHLLHELEFPQVEVGRSVGRWVGAPPSDSPTPRDSARVRDGRSLGWGWCWWLWMCFCWAKSSITNKLTGQTVLYSTRIRLGASGRALPQGSGTRRTAFASLVQRR